MNQSHYAAIKVELDRLTREFFLAVSFQENDAPKYENIHALFIEAGLLIKNTAATPEVSTVQQFIEPRLAAFRLGELTRFNEVELVESTEIFGKISHRFNSYAKSGMMKGVPFEARGMISTQFIQTPSGWKVSAMAWDDEGPGIPILSSYEPIGRGKLSHE
jgi:hypothetical protein